jgi:hypothetical protein
MRDVVMVRAIDDCITKQPGMLSFLSGEVFAVLAKPSKTYWKGQHKGKIGRFPAAKVEPIADADPAALYSAGVSPSAEALAQLSPRSRLEAKTLQFFRVRAIADYQPAAGGAHLRFSEGESFCVLSRETPDWWKGQHKGRIGRFPRDHVVEIDEAGDEIAPRPRVGEVPLTGSPSHRGGKLFDDDTSVSSLHEEDSTTSTTTSHTTTTTDSSKLNDSGKKRKKKKRETIAFIASGASSSTAIDSSGAPLTPKSGGATSPPVSARASAASPRATAASPRATAASPQADAPSPAAVASTRSGSSKRASSPVGSMMYRRALAGVEEAQRKLTTAVGEEEAANDTLRGLHAVVVSNDASCLAFQRQIESLEQEIKSKKVSKRERERMNGVLDGIKVEYDEQRGKQSTLQRQVDEATARADAARFAGVEARRLFETRSLELQRIIDREGRRGGLAQSAPVDAPQVPTAADVAADASASYSAAVRQALNRTSPTRARASSKGDVRADLPPPASAADTKAVADAPVRVGSWVRAKIPLEPSAAVLAASGLVAASVAADGPPPLPPMENVVQDSPNGTLLRPPRLLDDDDNDDDDDDTTEEQQ